MAPMLRRSSRDVLEIVKSECRPHDLALLDAGYTTGAVVAPVKEPLITTGEATMLGVSRPTLLSLVESSEPSGRRRRSSLATRTDFSSASCSRGASQANLLDVVTQRSATDDPRSIRSITSTGM